jgi:hypothetical protein
MNAHKQVTADGNLYMEVKTKDHLIALREGMF